MTINLRQKFWREVHPDFRSFCTILLSHGYYAVVVGGFVREFLLKSSKAKMETDLDVEIYRLDANGVGADHPQDEKSWRQEWRAILDDLDSCGFTIECKNDELKVYQVERTDLKFEMSLPRLEKYRSSASCESLNHSDFTAEISPLLSYQQSFKRRDLTINALGIEINLLSEEELKLIDPWKETGLAHLEKRILVPCDPENFAKDPVRFLRVLRMQNLRSGPFSFSSELEQQWQNFHLEQLTLHYFLDESFRTHHPLIFFQESFALIDRWGIPVPDFLKEFQLQIWPHLAKIATKKKHRQLQDIFSLVLFLIDLCRLQVLKEKELDAWLIRLQLPVKKNHTILVLVSALIDRDWEKAFSIWPRWIAAFPSLLQQRQVVDFFELLHPYDFVRQLIELAKEHPFLETISHLSTPAVKFNQHQLKQAYFQQLLLEAERREICPFDQKPR
jgi:hypothetical protein